MFGDYAVIYDVATENGVYVETRTIRADDLADAKKVAKAVRTFGVDAQNNHVANVVLCRLALDTGLWEVKYSYKRTAEVLRNN